MNLRKWDWIGLNISNWRLDWAELELTINPIQSAQITALNTTTGISTIESFTDTTEFNSGFHVSFGSGSDDLATTGGLWAIWISGRYKRKWAVINCLADLFFLLFILESTLALNIQLNWGSWYFRYNIFLKKLKKQQIRQSANSEKSWSDQSKLC